MVVAPLIRRYHSPMYIEAVPNRNSPPAILLRKSYREDGKIKKRTLLNLTDWPTELVEGFRTLLKGGKASPVAEEAIIVHRSFPHGHVAAALGALRKTGLDRVLGPAGNRCRDLVMAMVVMRLLSPASKLATARMLDAATPSTSLGEVLELGDVDENELYTALDWLGERQEHVEKVLARKQPSRTPPFLGCACGMAAKPISIPRSTRATGCKAPSASPVSPAPRPIKRVMRDPICVFSAISSARRSVLAERAKRSIRGRICSAARWTPTA